ncbi:MAG: hypothetical protein II716_11790 [Treponema sp.]|nr:hypothetical protein [Treponema sp.]
MKKSFLFFPALVLAGIFAASCSFNGASSDLSFAVNLPARAANDGDGYSYNYAVYVTGRALPWRGVITKDNNVITLENFPLGAEKTLYAGFSCIGWNSELLDAGIMPCYFGEADIAFANIWDRVGVSVSDSYCGGGVFRLPGGEDAEQMEIIGFPGGQQMSSPTYIRIINVPLQEFSDKGELCVCSFTYQTATYNENTSNYEYGPEIHAECPVWILMQNENGYSIEILNREDPIKISNVKLRRWGEKTWHEFRYTDSWSNRMLDWSGTSEILGTHETRGETTNIRFSW